VAIAVTRMVGTGTGTDGTALAIPAFTAAASTLYIATVGMERGGSQNPTTPVVTHNSITATEIVALFYLTTGSFRHKIWLFAWNSGAGSGSVAGNVDWGAVTYTGAEVQVYEVTGSDLVGGLAQTFVQALTTAADLTATSASITLAGASNAGNRPFAFWAHGANEETTIVGASWTTSTNVAHASPSAAMKAGWRTDAYDTAAAASWTTSSPYGGIAVELKVAGAAGGTSPVDPFGMSGVFGA
jgi:hypothetical protein